MATTEIQRTTFYKIVQLNLELKRPSLNGEAFFVEKSMLGKCKLYIPKVHLAKETKRMKIP